MNKFKESFPNSKIFSWYGHAEQVILAPWCEHTNKNHLWPFYGYTEILDEKDEAVKEGEEGELIGTSFHSFITPFIRYRTMDRAIKGQWYVLDVCDPSSFLIVLEVVVMRLLLRKKGVIYQ